MRLAAELFEHLLGLGRVGRLAEDPAVQHDGCVDADDRPLVRAIGDGPRLAGARARARPAPRRRRGGVCFFVSRRDDVERDAQLLEDRSALRRRRREQQRRSRAARQPRLRATQSSSDGHLLRPLCADVLVVRVRLRIWRCVQLDRAARSRSRSRAAGRAVSPCARWYSTSPVSSHSTRRKPNCGRMSRSFTPSIAMQRICSVELRRKTRRPPGRSRRAASGIQSFGSAQSDAPYSENEVERRVRRTARPRRSLRRAETRCRSPPASAAPSSSCAGVGSTPTTRAPRLASHAEKYAVPQPSSTTSRPRTSPRTFSSDSSAPEHAPRDLVLRPCLRRGVRVVRVRRASSPRRSAERIG